MRTKLILIAIVVVGMFALNEVAQDGLKKMGQVAIEKSLKR